MYTNSNNYEDANLNENLTTKTFDVFKNCCIYELLNL